MVTTGSSVVILACLRETMSSTSTMSRSDERPMMISRLGRSGNSPPWYLPEMAQRRAAMRKQDGAAQRAARVREAPIAERSEQEPIEAQRRAAQGAARVREAPIVERSEQEPIEAQRRAATRKDRASQCDARVREAPIVERSEQEPIEAQRRAATREIRR